MKKRAFALVLCILLLTACASTNIRGEVPTEKSPGSVNVKKVSSVDTVAETSSKIYKATACAGPEGYHLGFCLISGENGAYFTGSASERSCVFFTDSAGTEVTQLASLHDLNISDLCLLENNTLLLLTTTFRLSDDTAEDIETTLIELSPSGEELRRTSLQNLFGDLPPDYMEYANGILYFLGNGLLTAAKLTDPLTVVYQKEVEPGAVLALLPDGQAVLGQGEYKDYSLHILSSEKAEWKNTVCFDTAFTFLNSGGATYSLYLSDGSSLYGFDYETNTLTKLFAWASVGISSGAVCETESGKLFCTGMQGKSSKGPLLLINELEEETVAKSGPVTLTLATIDGFKTANQLGSLIQEWNCTHPNCIIEIKDYSVYNTEGDTRAGEMRLAADIASGNIPDMYDLSRIYALYEGEADERLSVGLLARRGMLEDIYPYISSDSELSYSDFYENLFSAMEIGGCLYEVVDGWEILTAIAPASVLDPENEWTYNALNAIVSRDGRFSTLFPLNMNRMDRLEYLVDASGSKLIDWEIGECYFDSDYFISLLEAAKTLPETVEQEDSEQYTSLLSMRQVSVFNVNQDIWNIYGGDYAYVGLPELGNVARLNECYGISAFSQHKDVCWQFLRQLLLPGRAPAGSSIRRDYNENRRQEDMEYLRTVDIYTYCPIVDELYEQAFSLMEKIDLVSRHDPQIWSIVQSAVGAYFAGDKTAEQTARIIQSKAAIYIAEQG